MGIKSGFGPVANINNIQHSPIFYVIIVGFGSWVALSFGGSFAERRKEKELVPRHCRGARLHVELILPVLYRKLRSEDSLSIEYLRPSFTARLCTIPNVRSTVVWPAFPHLLSSSSCSHKIDRV
jgi:hypothetical protein